MAVAGLALGAVAVGAGVFYLLESPTSPVPYATSRCASTGSSRSSQDDLPSPALLAPCA
jgi:hypothetical protein